MKTKSNMTVVKKNLTTQPKELDWEIRYDEIQKEWEKHRTMNTCSICDSPKGHTTIKDFITETLTQQRAELLEEIKKIVEEQLFWYEGEDYSSITAREALNQVKNLLNKKDAK